ncbi:hypothetical protein LDENG_00161050 [Lucifuga dentata]|nr:hypothetical protein LDENG_00161050 [Lucifuga dentata]
MSDQKDVFVQVLLPPFPSKPPTLILSCHLNSVSSHRFCQALTSSTNSFNPSVGHFNFVDELLNVFNSTCVNILDSIAPVRDKRLKSSFLPWLNEDLRHLKRQCRKAKRKWKKYKLAESLVLLKSLMSSYQVAVKNVRDYYFSQLITKQGHNPTVLFKTINSVISPSFNHVNEASLEICEEFLKYFNNKITEIKHHILPNSREFDIISCPYSQLTHFNKISLLTLDHTVAVLNSC